LQPHLTERGRWEETKELTEGKIQRRRRRNRGEETKEKRQRGGDRGEETEGKRGEERQRGRDREEETERRDIG
jgi:hypothetical protein